MRPESQQLHAGDLVLLHETRYLNDRGRERKLDYKWSGPYRIRSIGENSTYYMLEELDGTPLRRSFAGNRIKRFFSRLSLDEIREEMHEVVRVQEGVEDRAADTDEGEERPYVDL